MAVAAEATKTLRVGALVFDNDYKHPAVLAKEIATLDRLSDGRVELGIGAGWMKTDYDALGMPYDSRRCADRSARRRRSPSSRARGAPSRSASTATTTRSPTTTASRSRPSSPGRRSSWAGEDRGSCAWPVATPTSSASTRTCAPERSRTTRRRTRSRRWSTGRSDGSRKARAPASTTSSSRSASSSRRSPTTAKALAEAAAPGFGLDAAAALESGITCIGTIDEICDQLVARRERWGVSYIVIGDDIFEAFAPVVERLAGT